jgi:hypothetical protein
MQKRCLSCGAQYALSVSGKRQKYCSPCSRRGIVRGRGLPASNLLKTKAAKSADPGRYVRLQVEAQKDQPNPVSFTTIEGRKGRVWLGETKDGGDDRLWRVSLSNPEVVTKDCGFTVPRKAPADIVALEGNAAIPLTRLEPLPPHRELPQPDIWPWPRAMLVSIYIEAERELQELGCGQRIVAIEIDGPVVHLEHNGRRVTMKRGAFKELIASNKRYRKRIAA